MQEFRRLILSLVIAPLWTIFYLSHPAASRDWFWPLMIVLFWFFTVIGFANFYARIARAHFPFFSSLLSFFGLPSFASLLRQSAAAHEKGTVNWRGRAYPTARAEARNSVASDSK
jgi:hypothetical protein